MGIRKLLREDVRKMMEEVDSEHLRELQSILLRDYNLQDVYEQLTVLERESNSGDLSEFQTGLRNWKRVVEEELEDV